MRHEDGRWDAAELPDQTGRRWLVTGATHGLGEATARAAALAGAALVLPARDVERAKALTGRLPGRHEIVHLDLSSLASIREAACSVGDEIDVLVNNAGTITRRRQETVDGFERQLAVNFLGPFAFTNLLLDRVRDRVVIVASGAHRSGRLVFSDPHFRYRRWGIGRAYAASKLADMMWGLALERRLRERGVGVQLVHPGWVMSNLYAAIGNPVAERVVATATRPLGMTPQEASATVLFAASEDLPACSYVGPDGAGALRGRPCLLGRSAAASDPQVAEQAWELGVRETGTDL